jgi:CHAT domain-containing protein/predicted negative regulator of RcsB-dependent stress response
MGHARHTVHRNARRAGTLASRALAPLLLAPLLLAAEARAQTQTLGPGTSVTRELGPAQSHVYEFTLAAGQFFALTVHAEDFNFSVRVVAPGGGTLEEVAHRRYGPLPLDFVAPEAGGYRLEIASLESGARSGVYRLEAGAVRAALARDLKEARAAAAFRQAEEARFRWEGEQLRLACERYTAAAFIWRGQGRRAEAAVALRQTGEARFVQGDLQGALRAFEEALALAGASGSEELTLEQLNNVGYVNIYLARVEEAAALFRQVHARLGASRGGGAWRRRVEAQLENNLGEVEYARGNLKASLAFFARALSLWEEAGDRRGAALAYLNAGYSHLDSGGVNEAAQEFERALRLWREAGDRRGEALTLTAQGNLHAHAGDRYAALALHRGAQELFHRLGDRQGEAVTSNGLGSAYEDLNLRQQAVDNYTAALRLNRETGNRVYEAVSAYYLGRVFRGAGDFARALEYYEASIALSRAGGESRMAALAMTGVAAVYTERRQFDEAARIYGRALDLYRLVGDLQRQALAHHGLGELLRARGDLEGAVAEYRRGLELFRRIRDPRGEAESNFWLAKLAQAQGRLDEALERSEASIRLVEGQRALMPNQGWRTSYFASVRRHFESYVDILMRLHEQRPGGGFAALAIQASERARARTLMEMLVEAKSEVGRDVDPALLARERALRRQLSAKAAYQVQVLNSARPAAEVAEVELELRRLNAEYDLVQAQIRAGSPAYASLTNPPPLSLEQIQAALREDAGTVLLEYMLGEERSYVWAVTPDSLVARELPGRERLEALAGEVYGGLTARQQRPGESPAQYRERYTAAEARLCTGARELGRLALAPLPAGLKSERLLVVTDGDLSYIPFDALPSPEDAGGCRPGAAPPGYTPLLTSFEVVHLPSFSSLALLRRLNPAPPERARRIAVWADPVFETDDPRVTFVPEPDGAGASDGLRALVQRLALGEQGTPPARLLATRDEADSIVRFAPAGAVTLLTGSAASPESVVGRDLDDYRILHFATHGLINNRYPSLSSLLLSTVDERGRSRDGLLQLRDIYGLRLNADLVVLSGCRTGLGEEFDGEGLVGLTQGFLYAGSRSVIVSLWSVQDQATADLMADFYREMLEEGAMPSAALRRAKLKMYERVAWQSPYYWSAFVIEGEFRAPPRTWRSRLSTRTLWAGVALTLVIFWLAYNRFGRRARARA